MDLNLILSVINTQNKIFINKLIAQHYPLTLNLIDKYLIDWKIDYSIVSMNKNINWDQETIEYFLNLNKDIYYLYKNSSVFFNEEIIKNNKSNLDWVLLSSKKELPWSLNLIEKYKDLWDWDLISGNESILWSPLLVDKYFYDINFYELSKIPHLDWLEPFVKKKIELLTVNLEDFCKQHDMQIEGWEWAGQPESKDIFFVPDNSKDWSKLSSDVNLPWSIKYISKRKRFWDWATLSLNPNLPWSIEILDKFEKLWNWGYLSSNTGLLWNMDLIDRYYIKWNWDSLCQNVAINWNITLIEKYFSSINWSLLSENPNLKFTESLIKKYENKWDWNSLSSNPNFIWNQYILDKYLPYIIWENISTEGEEKVFNTLFKKLNDIEISNILDSQICLETEDYLKYEPYDDGSTYLPLFKMEGYSIDDEYYNDELDFDQQGPDFDF